MPAYGRMGDVKSLRPGLDPTISPKKLPRGTVRRVLTYARPYRVLLTIFLIATALDAMLTVVNPLLARNLVNDGILTRDGGIVVGLASVMVAVALFDCLLGVLIGGIRRGSARASPTTCAPRSFGTSCGSRWRSSPGRRPVRWSAGSTPT